MMTKGELVEEIKYELGEIWNPDSRFDDRFILRKINEALAFLIKKSAFESNNLEGITATDVGFLSIYTNIPVSSEVDPHIGLKFIVTPVQPIGLPRQRAFKVFPTITFGGIKSTTFAPIGAHEISSYMSLPAPPNTIFYFLQQDRIYLLNKRQSVVDSYTALNLEVASAGGNSMTERLNMPSDTILELKQIVIPQLRAMQGVGEDKIEDGKDVKS